MPAAAKIVDLNGMDPNDVNILVVDDVNTVRIQLNDLLKSFGFGQIRTAGSVPEATRVLASEPVHLILCDWHMSPMTGFEFLRSVRQHPEHQKVAFIMVTAEATKERVLEAIQAGVDDYIVKPLTLSQMNKIYKVLVKRQVIE